MANIGDTVRFLNTVGGGKIKKIEGQVAYVEDEDGFETPSLLRELVVVAPAGAEPSKTTFKAVKTAESPTPAQTVKNTIASTPSAPTAPTPKPAIEVDGGNMMNLTLAYEPLDVLRISETEFDAFLVNDSNYWLAVAYSTRRDDEQQWTLRYSGVIEPNMQEWMGEVSRDNLVEMDYVRLQCLAYKRDKKFDEVPVIDFKSKLDTTRFCRLHALKANRYFDGTVIALDVVRDGVPVRNDAVTEHKAPAEEPVAEMMRKRRVDSRPVKRKTRTNVSRRDGEKIVVDLHIDQLLDTTAGMSPADMLNHQIDVFRQVMDSNMSNKGQQIIFIHGKGEGVLRNALMKELRHRYKTCAVQDASFGEYGFGATQVTI